MLGQFHCFIHGSQLREGGILWLHLRAGQKDVAERRWRGVIEKDRSAFRTIVVTTFPKQRAKSKDIVGEREFRVITAIDLKRSAIMSGVKTLEVTDDKRV